MPRHAFPAALQLREQLPIRVVALLADRSALDGGLHAAVGLVIVRAGRVAAAGEVGLELAEPVAEVGGLELAEPELAHAGRVDEARSEAERVQRRGGRRVRAAELPLAGLDQV